LQCGLLGAAIQFGKLRLGVLAIRLDFEGPP